LVSAGHDESQPDLEILRRDATSVIGRTKGEGGKLILVRRLARSRRMDARLRKELLTEGSFTGSLDCPRCPRAHVVRLEDGEIVLHHDHAEGVEMDRLLHVLERGGRVLAPITAIALLAEVFHQAEHIASQLVGESLLRGHGEIEPRAIMLGPDGFGRLYDARFAASGFRATATPIGRFCRAPELAGAGVGRSPRGDVYGIGAVLALVLYGPSTMLRFAPEAAFEAISRAKSENPGAVPEELVRVIERAVSFEPDDRPATAYVLRDALRASLQIDFSAWRLAIEGLAALAEALAEDRGATGVPAPLFDLYPDLTKPAFAHPDTVLPSLHSPEEQTPALQELSRPTWSQPAPKGPEQEAPPLAPSHPLEGVPIAQPIAEEPRPEPEPAIEPEPLVAVVPRRPSLAVIDESPKDPPPSTDEVRVPRRSPLPIVAMSLFAAAGVALALMLFGTRPVPPDVLIPRDPPRHAAIQSDPPPIAPAPDPKPAHAPTPEAQAPAKELEQQPEPKVEPKIEPKAETKIEPKAEPKIEPPEPSTRVGEAPTEPPIPAVLIIEVSPWGYIFVDGRAYGPPPVLIDDLTAGPHKIRVERPGYRSIEEDVHLEGGEEHRVHLKLGSDEPSERKLEQPR
jgi:hypothetical protein